MTKLVLKCGDIEVEYDGPEDFLKQELPLLIKAVAELRSSAPTSEERAAGKPGGAPGALSVSTVAQRLSAKKAPDLVIAAAYSFVQAGTTTISKQQLRDRMKEATSFYKASYANNFDKTVARLTKLGRLNHLSGTNYALSDSEKLATEARLSVPAP